MTALVRRNKTSHLAIAALLTFGCSSASAITVVIQPGPNDGKDISLYERTDIELSSSKSLYAIHTGPPGPGLDDFTSLIEFDLSSVPVGTVASATLWLYENNVPTFSFQHVSSGFSNTISVEPASAPWEESTVFYSTIPDPAPGYQVLQTVDAVNQWFSWDVTAMVADWLGGSLVNNGFIITSTEEVRNGLVVVGASFDASDEANAPFNAPYLEIELTIPGDFDEDCDVDGSDFLKWQRGETNPPLSPVDLTAWENNYGFSFPVPAGGAAVPEPTSIILWLVLTVHAGVHRWRSISSQ